MAATKSEMNVYVPAHQIRNNGHYLWVKWWKGNDTWYAHFHQATHADEFLLHSIGRNENTIAEQGEASLSRLPDGLLETLRIRYSLAEYQEESE